MSIALSAACRASLAALCLAALLCGCGQGDGAAQGGVEEAPATRARSDASGTGELFVDVASAVGIDYTYFNGMTGELQALELIGAGAALFDYDGDGDLDAYLVQGRMMEDADPIEKALFPPRHPLPLSGRLYRNDLIAGRPESLRFVDVTEASGIGAIATGYGQGVAVGDYDGDGRPDLYLTNFGRDQLLRNLPRRDLARRHRARPASTRITGASPPRSSTPIATAISTCGSAPTSPTTRPTCRPATTSPARSTTAAPESSRPSPTSSTAIAATAPSRTPPRPFGLGGVRNPALGVAVADFDDNGWLDLFVANDARPNLLWLAEARAGSSRARCSPGWRSPAPARRRRRWAWARATTTATVRLDLFKTNLVREGSTLYRNLGGGVFADSTQEARLLAPTRPFTSFGCGFLDYDNDGWLDLFQVSGAIQRIPALVERGDPFPLHQPNQLFTIAATAPSTT